MRGTSDATPAGATRDVTIYAPYACALYERDAGATGGGGAELQTTLLALGLAKRGLDVAHVVFPVTDPRPLEGPAPTLVARRAADSSSALHPVRELRDVWRALSDADARIVVVRGSGGYVVPAAAWCRRHRRAMVFASSNDLDFDLQRPDRRAATLRAYGRAVRRARRLVVQTQRQAQLARQTFPGLEPILIPSFAQPAAPAGGEPEYFLWVDRLTPIKRPGKLLDLAAALPDARFRMIAPESSETPPELKEAVYRRAESLPNVDIVSQQSREQLFEAMRRAAAVVKTSKVEGMPNTFLEAWSRGLPVLSLSVDPDRRIEEHRIGLLADGSMDRFAEHARRLWDDPELRAELGARGRDFVTATHAPESVTDRWEALIAETLAQR